MGAAHELHEHAIWPTEGNARCPEPGSLLRLYGGAPGRPARAAHGCCWSVTAGAERLSDVSGHQQSLTDPFYCAAWSLLSCRKRSQRRLATNAPGRRVADGLWAGAGYSLAPLVLLPGRLDGLEYSTIGLATVIWGAIQRWVWQAHLLERFLQLEQRTET